MNYKILIASVILISASLTNSCGGRKFQFVCGISEVSQIGINHLQPLVDAMEQYKKDNGRYPVGIDIAPRYIDKIPIISSGGEQYYDESHFNVLKHEKLSGGIGVSSDDGSYFSLKFTPIDDRICLMGRNNICEYRSDTKQWGCYQH